jgi:hypothetical protein
VLALCASTRNLTDEQIDASGASGGLIGIVFAVAFLRADGRDDADTPLDTLVAHARHVADRIGAEHVALGSDFDGATIPAQLGDAAACRACCRRWAMAASARPRCERSPGRTGAARSRGHGPAEHNAGDRHSRSRSGNISTRCSSFACVRSTSSRPRRLSLR